MAKRQKTGENGRLQQGVATKEVAPTDGFFEAKNGENAFSASKKDRISGHLKLSDAEISELYERLWPEKDGFFDAVEGPDSIPPGPKKNDPAATSNGSAKKKPDHGQNGEPKDPRGRKRALDAFTRGRVCELLGLGLSQRHVAAYVGVGRATLQREIDRDKEFARAVKRCRQLAFIQPLLVIVREAKTNWRAATWLMKFLREQLDGEDSVFETLKVLDEMVKEE